MTIEQIEKFIAGNKEDLKEPAKIFFKTRGTVEGIFIRTSDFLELKKKNFWRIVSSKNLTDYKESKDINLSRIFNGAEFTRLSQK
ncbi:short-chain dehydrogenase [Flavitalea sp. BT771]|uniref:short-chain dehydrogenase n=1 Tax=Flavitalea sp. BT771 TaxID=3063329 RepID=UPI0026E349CA|nr:short-chain dehydrogenase [Flavitalea sp. BT771]MDO6432804.1 short-chain dehydrogenase [Flavitalea sp. BT771]MDV6221920.1 short-chain dehydrogenase [Flavitalea sp. BT771]